MDNPRRENSGEPVMVTEDLQVWGDIRLRADGLIRAQVRGNVTSSEKVILEKGKEISGTLEGSDVRVEGEVRGGILAKGQVWIGAGAKVGVRCHGRSLRIEPGAEFKGELQIG